MKKKIEYTDEPMGEIKIIEDTFPRPEELIFKEDDLEVTITMSNQSIKYFKNQAKKNNTQYKKMIRYFLEKYVSQHQEK